MAQNWIALASNRLQWLRPRTGSPRRRRAGVRVEGLETRLALSSSAVGSVLPNLNPQPLPPGIVAAPIRATASSDDWNAPTTVRFTSGGTGTPDSNGPHIENSVASRQTDKSSPVLWQNVAAFVARPHTPPITFSPDPGSGCNLGGCLHMAALAYSRATSSQTVTPFVTGSHGPATTFPPDPI